MKVKGSILIVATLAWLIFTHQSFADYTTRATQERNDPGYEHISGDVRVDGKLVEGIKVELLTNGLLEIAVGTSTRTIDEWFLWFLTVLVSMKWHLKP